MMRLALLLLLTGCISTGTVLEPAPPNSVDPDALAARAWSDFERQPRTEANVRAAFDAMRDAARGTADGDAIRFERLVTAARYGIWLGRHATEAGVRSEAADRAITVCNTAVQADGERVEGHYLRAVAVGLFAQENEVYGVDAMSRIRTDARRALDLDESFDGAGPHRVLGALYLRAPGPPAGVGSTRRAIRHLEAAHRMAPEHPENLLFLAEAYIETGRSAERVPDLLDAAAALVPAMPDDHDRVASTRWLVALRDRRP